MNRLDDINQLLNEIKNNFFRLKYQYSQAKRDESIEEILRPLVKNTLDNLRSILEYSTRDIWDSYKSNRTKTKSSKTKRLYFPHGDTKYKFLESINENLPNLETYRPNVYLLIESLQPHICQDSWLIQLCDQNNFHKHDRLKKQERYNSPSSTTRVGDFAIISGEGELVIENCLFNEIPLGQDEPLIISSRKSVKEIQEAVGSYLPINRVYDWVEFRFEDSSTDTLSLIEKSYKNIKEYVMNLYEMLS